MHVKFGPPKVSTKSKFDTTGILTRINASQGGGRFFDKNLILNLEFEFEKPLSKSIFVNLIQNSLLHNLRQYIC